MIAVKQYKEKEVLTRSEIAARLRRIADEIEQGSISPGGSPMAMPSQAKFKLEVKPNELEIEIKWR